MEATERDCKVSWREVDGKRVPYGRLTFRAVRADEEFPVDEANHRMWFRASLPGDPGDGLDIPVSAWKKHIKDYMEKNPTFIWGHQYIAEGFPTILNVFGHATDFRLVDEGKEDRDGLYLLDDFGYDVNPLAKMAWHMFMRRDLNAVSVGWDTLEYHTEDRDGRQVYILDTVMLLEHSACILPMEPNALAQGRMDARSYMLSKAADYPELADGLRRVLGDSYCSDLFCNRKPDEDELEIAKQRDRIEEVIERLERIETAVGEILDDEFTVKTIRLNDGVCRWKSADSSGQYIEFRFNPDAPHEAILVDPGGTSPRYEIPDDVKELVESYRSLGSEALRDKARTMIDEMQEELQELNS